MSKWITLTGMILDVVGSVFFFIRTSFPVLEPWYIPVLSAGILFTIGGVVGMIIRGDW